MSLEGGRYVSIKKSSSTPNEFKNIPSRISTLIFPISVVAKQMAVVLSRIYPLIVSKEISAKDFNGWEQMPVQVRESS